MSDIYFTWLEISSAGITGKIKAIPRLFKMGLSVEQISNAL
ncbi:MAG: hypothetical protein QNJ49_10820 [Mastigocoleus sp. MO_167.B18]|nr:hypothetical protein [Mastigocoleus sp. MO_167.B18]